MRNVDKSALVPYSAAQMYRLVNDVESYPEFLPWCRNAKVEVHSNTEVRASLELSRGGVHKWFTTLNTLQENQRIDISLENGPFRHLEGHWRFNDLDDHGCKVNLSMAFEFSNPVLNMVFGPVFHEICNSLVDAFIHRARTVYEQGW